MYLHLDFRDLKSGERMETGVVQPPDNEWSEQLKSFLSHKGSEWKEEIELAFRGELDDLESRFYVGRIGNQVICQIMLTGSRGAGIVSHVFTRPEQRQKGAISALMNTMMEHCRSIRFQVITLGTGFDSAAYWIYHKFGFRSVRPGSGEMIWVSDDEKLANLFSPSQVHLRPVQWEDWAYFNLLALQPVNPEEDLPRSKIMGLKGQGSLEGPFIKLQIRRGKEPELHAFAIVNEADITVGWAIMGQDPSWFRDVWILDLHIHRLYKNNLTKLVSELPLPKGMIVSYLLHDDSPKAKSLERSGFLLKGRLPGWLEHSGRHELLVMMRDNTT